MTISDILERIPVDSPYNEQVWIGKDYSLAGLIRDLEHALLTYGEAVDKAYWAGYYKAHSEEYC